MAYHHIDLSYLERLYKGDRSRMEHWVRIYLDDAPALFLQLRHSVQQLDANALISTAHDLRPLAHYLGAQHLLDLLVRIGQEARSAGVHASEGLVTEAIAQGKAVEAELRSAFSGG